MVHISIKWGKSTVSVWSRFLTLFVSHSLSDSDRHEVWEGQTAYRQSKLTILLYENGPISMVVNRLQTDTQFVGILILERAELLRWSNVPEEGYYSSSVNKNIVNRWQLQR